MSRRPKAIGILMSLTLMLFVALPSWAGEVKIALDCPEDLDKCGSYVWSYHFSEYLKANKMEVKLYPRDALGNEEEKLDQLSQGLLEVSGCSPLSKAGQLDPFIFGFYLPYLFDSIAHVDRVIAKTDLIKKVNAGLTKKGVRLLAMVPVGGSSGLGNTKRPVAEPEDLKGLRMRALDKKQAMWFEALGASTVIIPWAEIYNALQTGVADGYANPPIVPVMFKHTELIKYWTDARISVPFRVTLCSEDWYQGLSDKERAVVDEGVAKADAANRVWQKKIDQGGLEALRATGVQVSVPTPEQLAKFAALIRPIYGKLVSPEVAQEFAAAADKYR